MRIIQTFLLILLAISVFGQAKQNPSDFLPKGYVVFEKITGDLNKDHIDDCILLIKGTDTGKIITDEFRGRLDRNRRGMIILFRKNGKYELALKNYNCFSSENEDGGVYFAPELSIEIGNGNLYVQYGHGRYGNWKYTFRNQRSGFELIGYDASDCRGPIINSMTSINFLTKTKQVKLNINENADSGEEEFKTRSTKIKVGELIKLSGIKDFDELDFSNL